MSASGPNEIQFGPYIGMGGHITYRGDDENSVIVAERRSDPYPNVQPEGEGDEEQAERDGAGDVYPSPVVVRGDDGRWRRLTR